MMQLVLWIQDTPLVFAKEKAKTQRHFKSPKNFEMFSIKNNGQPYMI